MYANTSIPTTAAELTDTDMIHRHNHTYRITALSRTSGVTILTLRDEDNAPSTCTLIDTDVVYRAARS